MVQPLFSLERQAAIKFSPSNQYPVSSLRTSMEKILPSQGMVLGSLLNSVW